MRSKRCRQFIFIGMLICLIIGIPSLQGYAQQRSETAPPEDQEIAPPPPPSSPERKPVLYDDITPAYLTSLMTVAPADPLLVIQIKDAAQALGFVEDSVAWGRIREAPVWEMAWAFAEMRTEVKDSQRLIRPSLSIVSHLLGQDILFVLPKFQGLLEMSPTLLIHVDRSGDLGEILASAIEVGLANIPDTAEREYNGFTYLVTKPVGPGMRLSFGLFDNLLVASLGESTIKQVIDLYRGESTESLANDPGFAQVMERLQPNILNRVTDFQASFYADIASIYQFAKLMYPMAQEQMPEQIRPLADQAVEWPDLLQSITGVANLTKEGVLSQSYTRLNPQATANHFLAMLQAPPAETQSLQFVPADTAGYVSSNLIDLPKLWEMAMGVVDSLPPEINEQVHTALEAVQTQFNLNLEADLFSWMGNEIAVVNLGNLMLTMPGKSDSAVLQSLPSLLFLIKTTDSLEAAESLTHLENGVTMALAATKNVSIEWQTTDYQGTPIHTAEIPDAPIHPGYAIAGDYVLITLDSSVLKTALDCAAGRSEGLSSLEQFHELRARAPERVNTISYMNPARSLMEGWQTLVSGVKTHVEAEGTGMGQTDAELMQTLLPQIGNLVKAVAQIFIGQIQYTVKDGDGLRGYSFLKTQDLDESVVFTDTPEAKVARSLFIARGYMEHGMLARAHAYLDRVLAIDENQPEALMMKVALLESEGDEKRANGYRRRLGFVRESAWSIIGPFPNPDGEGFDTAYPPEMGVNLEETYETESGAVDWEKRQDDNPDDSFVNFAQMFEETDWQVAYAWTTVTAPEAREVELRIGSDDDIKVWVNGIDVLIDQVGRSAEPDQDRVHISLQQGANKVLVKVCNREQDWGFYLRFTDENGHPIQGLTSGD